MSPRFARRRGTTFAELLVYMGLLTAGLLVVGGLEQMAGRTLQLEQALIDIEMQAAGLLGAVRLDVARARRLELDAGALVIERHDGRRVRYDAGRRTESGGALPAERVEAFPLNTALAVSYEVEGPPGASPILVVDATFTSRGRDGKVERTFRRTASPRAEVGR
jgi:hypothetical protein